MFHRSLIAFIITFLIAGTSLNAQSIKGVISDEATGEFLVGATVLIQGTYTGTITDLEGRFELKNVKPGRYNLVISYISYDTQIQTVEVTVSGAPELNIRLKSVSLAVEEVTVVGKRRTDTEAAIVANIRLMDVIANGISADQIKRSQDSDAAEVIKRVPGITITNGRFVIVRGLSERYSHVMLNRSPAPSFETDKKSFSFDAIPSGMIQNIMIYKSPAPELPADFAGAVIDIMTKEVADKNEFKISYSAGYVEGTSFNDQFLSYEGGKLDFLGFEDGSRSFPKELPSPEEMQNLYVWPNATVFYQRMDSLQTISRAFNNNWNTKTIKPFLDHSLSAVFQRRFLLGKASAGNITALNFKHNNDYTDILRKEYYLFDFTEETAEVAYDYKDKSYKQEANLGILHNWLLIFGNNQRIGFRNLFNNLGEQRTTYRTGDDGYNTVKRINTNLRFQQRMIYSGQLDGNHLFNNNLTSLKWLAAYSYVNNNDPDNRRYSYFKPLSANDSVPYDFVVDNTPSVYYGGRMSQTLTENNYNMKLDLSHDINTVLSNSPVQVRTGVYIDHKSRDFDTRLVGVVAPRGTDRLFVGDLSAPAEELLSDSNFYYTPGNPNITGFMYRDGSSWNNNYEGTDKISAAYAGLKVPFKDLIEIYGGIRMEKFNRLITGFYNPELLGDTADIHIDTLNLFPSVNLKVKLGAKHNIRASWGKTTNRPEFRESSPIIYEDFDEIAIINGNPDLKLAYVSNYDLRYEYYPNPGEILSLAFFYKAFTNPVEMFLIPAGTGWNYKPFNTEKAFSRGLETDVRKSLTFLEGMPVIGALKNLTLVFNASVIKSEINTDKDFARDSVRIMQGQSPYIINMGMFYANPDNGLMVSMNYNRIGERIVFAGTPSQPHMWEMPRNAVDLTIDKKFGEHFELKLGVKDLLNEPVIYRAYFGEGDEIPLLKRYYVPGRKISFGMSWTF